MRMLQWMVMPLRRYADFSGRSRRREYWSFFLLNLVVTGVLLGPLYAAMLASMAAVPDRDPAALQAMAPGPVTMGLAVLGGLWALGTLIPNIAVTVRRFHDRAMSGWWYLGFILLAVVPFVGLVAIGVFLLLMALPGTRGENRYGPDPKAAPEGATERRAAGFPG